MSYGTDQCVRCGGIRVANSTLCVDCLVAMVNSFAPAQDIAEAKIKELEGQVEKLKGLCERLLDHITQNLVHKSLYEAIREDRECRMNSQEVMK